MQDMLPGNQITLLQNGAEFFPALLAAIDAATAEVSLETYIFENDATGRQVAQALMRAAGRGVAVRVLVDGFGGPHFHKQFIPDLEAAGVRAMIHNRFWLFPAFSRLHRKVAVVDGRLAFVGGINIVDDDPHLPGHAPFRLDYAVCIEGPLVARIREDARVLWNRTAWRNLKRKWRVKRLPRDRGSPGPLKRSVAAIRSRLGGRLGTARADLEVRAPGEGIHAAFVIRNNFRHRRDIEKAYLEAIRGARKEIILANAYFLPGVRFRRALEEAAARGVKVTVLLQGLSDYWPANYAGQELYASLLAANIRLLTYQRSFLHAKVAVVDGRWATVGSSNLDVLSTTHAQEANVIVLDGGFAAQLRASLEAAMRDGGQELRLEDLRHRPWHLRLRCFLIYGLVRFLGHATGWR